MEYPLGECVYQENTSDKWVFHGMPRESVASIPCHRKYVHKILSGIRSQRTMGRLGFKRGIYNGVPVF